MRRYNILYNLFKSTQLKYRLDTYCSTRLSALEFPVYTAVGTKYVLGDRLLLCIQNDCHINMYNPDVHSPIDVFTFTMNRRTYGSIRVRDYYNKTRALIAANVIIKVARNTYLLNPEYAIGNNIALNRDLKSAFKTHCRFNVDTYEHYMSLISQQY